MSFDRACEICGRDRTTDGRPLEVCFSDVHDCHACLVCHFCAAPESTMPPKSAENS